MVVDKNNKKKDITETFHSSVIWSCQSFIATLYNSFLITPLNSLNLIVSHTHTSTHLQTHMHMHATNTFDHMHTYINTEHAPETLTAPKCITCTRKKHFCTSYCKIFVVTQLCSKSKNVMHKYTL